MASCRSSFDGDETRTWSAWIAACTFFSLLSFRNLTMSFAASVGMPCWRVTTRRTVSLAARSIVARREVLGRHAATDHASLQDLPQRVHLELVVGGERERVLGPVQVDRRARALEVVALRDFLARLVDRVVDFLEVDAGRDVEGDGVGHALNQDASLTEPCGTAGSCFCGFRQKSIVETRWTQPTVQ